MSPQTPEHTTVVCSGHADTLATQVHSSRQSLFPPLPPHPALWATGLQELRMDLLHPSTLGVVVGGSNHLPPLCGNSWQNLDIGGRHFGFNSPWPMLAPCPSSWQDLQRSCSGQHDHPDKSLFYLEGLQLPVLGCQRCPQDPNHLKCRSCSFRPGSAPPGPLLRLAQGGAGRLSKWCATNDMDYNSRCKSPWKVQNSNSNQSIVSKLYYLYFTQAVSDFSCNKPRHTSPKSRRPCRHASVFQWAQYMEDLRGPSCSPPCSRLPGDGKGLRAHVGDRRQRAEDPCRSG